MKHDRSLSLASLLSGLAIAASMLVWPLPAASAGGPSFDCAAAKAPDEVAICASPELAEMDLMIDKAYRGYTPEFGKAKDIARALLNDRRACRDDTACIGAALYNALDTFKGIAYVSAWVPRYVEAMLMRKAAAAYARKGSADEPMPAKLGQCSITKIAALTTRFGEPLEGADAIAGSAVEYTNDGRQVSYSLEEGLAGSAEGQPVAVCLIAIPRDCPAGDDRGRLYLGLNLETQGSWVLTDTQHMCGGA